MKFASSIVVALAVLPLVLALPSDIDDREDTGSTAAVFFEEAKDNEDAALNVSSPAHQENATHVVLEDLILCDLEIACPDGLICVPLPESEDDTTFCADMTVVSQYDQCGFIEGYGHVWHECADDSDPDVERLECYKGRCFYQSELPVLGEPCDTQYQNELYSDSDGNSKVAAGATVPKSQLPCRDGAFCSSLFSNDPMVGRCVDEAIGADHVLYVSALLSNWVYNPFRGDKYGSVNEWKEDAWGCPQEVRLIEVDREYRWGAAVKYGTSNMPACFIVWKGTTFSSWKNLKDSLSTLPYTDFHDVKSSPGMVRYTNAMINQMTQAYVDFADSGECGAMVITGHSLGGAAASLHAYDLIKRGLLRKNLPHYVHVFGSMKPLRPKPANDGSTISSAYVANGIVHSRWEAFSNASWAKPKWRPTSPDPIPTWPWFWQHVGSQRKIDSVTNDGLKTAHSSENYINSLAKAYPHLIPSSHHCNAIDPKCANRIFLPCDFDDLLDKFWNAPDWNKMLNGECNMLDWVKRIIQSPESYENMVGTALQEFDTAAFPGTTHAKMQGRFSLFVVPWLLSLLHSGGAHVNGVPFNQALKTVFQAPGTGPTCSTGPWHPRSIALPHLWNTSNDIEGPFEPDENGVFMAYPGFRVWIDGYPFSATASLTEAPIVRLDDLKDFVADTIAASAPVTWSSDFRQNLWSMQVSTVHEFGYPTADAVLPASSSFREYRTYANKAPVVSYAEATSPLTMDFSKNTAEWMGMTVQAVCNPLSIAISCDPTIPALDTRHSDAYHWFVNGRAGVEGTPLDDRMVGDDTGNHFLTGPGGSDEMVGNGGPDRFVANGGLAIVEDFNPAEGDSITVIPSAYGIGGKDYLSFYSGLRYEYVNGDYIIQVTGTGQPIVILRNVPQNLNLVHYLNVPGQTCNTNHFGCKNAIYNVDVTESHLACWAKDTDADRSCQNHFDCCDGECIQFSSVHGKQCKGGCRWNMGLCRHDGDCCYDLMCIGGLCADLEHGW
eukprot:Clim_evm3s10 gene=Clim_evmTU3s10